MCKFFKIETGRLKFKMYKNTGTFLLIFLLGRTAFAGIVEDNYQTLIISNPLFVMRANELIAVPRKYFPLVNECLFPLVKKGNKIYITQTIDSNYDGHWDELLVQVSLAAHSKDTLQVSWIKKDELQAFQKVTDVHLSLRSNSGIPTAEINEAIRYRGFTQNIAKPYYQMEGPGIENDKVAFRFFFDYRNGKDIYGKILDTLMLDRVGVGASWHEMQYWGKDILKVGNSLGAGAIAVQENNQIIRLGDADTATFKVLYEGPLQASFVLDFKQWDVANGKQNGNETISIRKGNFYYKNDITLSLSRLQHLVAGFANFGIDKVTYSIYNKQFSAISTFGKQADGTDTNLGLAIMFRTDEYIQHATTDSSSSVSNTSCVSLKPSAKKAIYFFACWEKTDQRFSSQEGFQLYLKETATKLANPIELKLLKNK